MNMEYFQKHVRRPSLFLHIVLNLFVRMILFPYLHVRADAKAIRKRKGPYLLLFNHPSKLDFAYAYGHFPKQINSIIAFYYFCNYRFGKLLHKVGGFPKYLFSPDISAVRNIKKVIGWGNILGIAPEGRLAAYGEIETIVPATDKLIKHLEIPVVVAHINGAYFTNPKWAETMRRGKVTVTYEEILTAESIRTMTVEQIDALLHEKLYYNDFAWQKEHHVYYKGKKFSEGLEHILYICPVCHQEFTYQAKGNHLTCSSCGTDVVLNHYYEFETKEPKIPENIREWYLFQKETERARIEDPAYELKSHVTLKMPDPQGNGFVVVGSGTTVLNHQGITYTGTVNGEEKTILFKIENLPAIPFGVKEDFEIYHGDTLYYFIPDNIRECVKWSIVGELMYQKHQNGN